MELIDAQWFRGRLADRKMSQRKLAKAMQIDPSRVSLLLSGKKIMRMIEAENMAAVLDVRVDEILYHAGIRGLFPGEKTVEVAIRRSHDKHDHDHESKGKHSRDH